MTTGALEFVTPTTFQALSGRTVRSELWDAAAEGRFEGFKTTNAFDGTAKNPQWLGEADKGPG